MLDSVVVDSIRRLVAEGKSSMRKIARMSGVSRGTVLAIAHGKRSDRVRRSPEDADFLMRPSGPLRRCPGCGGMVQMPCRLCRVRVWKTSPRSTPPPRRPDQPLQMDLVGEHRLRYEEIRRERMNDERGNDADGAFPRSSLIIHHCSPSP